jgi:hypothetical protein
MIGTGVVGIIITLLVIAAVYFLLKLLIDRAPFISGEAKTWIDYILLALCIIWLITVLLGIAGYPIGRLGRW